MNWTLEHNGIERTLADWGLGRVRRRLVSQRPDTLTFEHAGAAADAPPLFSAETFVRVRRGGVNWFCGVVTRTPAAGAPGGEALAYEISGPWWQLENLVYQQLWREPMEPNNPASALTAVARSRLVLGQDDAGEALDTGQQAAAIAQFAAAAGAPLQLGVIAVPVPLPHDEARDLTCAEALRRVLRWAPDAVAWFDYSAAPWPALHIRRRGDLAAVSRATAGLSRLDIAPRHDLVRPAVVIKYEKTHTDDGFQWATTEVDAAPAGATGVELKALVLTLPLRGAHAAYVRQKVRAEAIAMTSATWWREHHPALRGVPVGDITVENAARESSLPRELVAGAVAPWMSKEAEEDVISADVSYHSASESVLRRRLAVRLVATNASTREYTGLAGYAPEETAPTGLAAALFAAVGELQFEGAIEWIEEEAGAGAWLGVCLNLGGGRPEWAAMRALVQEVEEALDEGATRVRFGPPRQLGAADLAELLRSSRRREPGAGALLRLSARPAAAADIAQGEFHPLGSASAGPGKYIRLTFAHPAFAGRVIEIDTADLPADLTVKLRELQVCVGGEAKTILALCSEPY